MSSWLAEAIAQQIPEVMRRSEGGINWTAFWGNLFSKDGIEKSIKSMVDKTRKPILAISNGIIIKFDSISDAHKQTNIQPSNICNVLKGKRKQAGGFYWQYQK